MHIFEWIAIKLGLRRKKNAMVGGIRSIKENPSNRAPISPEKREWLETRQRFVDMGLLEGTEPVSDTTPIRADDLGIPNFAGSSASAPAPVVQPAPVPDSPPIPEAAVPPPLPPSMPPQQPARADTDDPNVRPLQFQIGAQVIVALANARMMPEVAANRIGIGVDQLERIMVGREPQVSLSTLLALSRITGRRLDITLAPIQQSQPQNT